MTFKAIVILTSITLAIVSYLIGSLSFAIIFTRIYKKTDIRDHGSGNAGVTNVLRSAGKIPALLTLFGDFAKGLTAAGIGFLAFQTLKLYGSSVPLDPAYGAYIAGFFCFLGHLYPLYYGFRGGKGVLTLAAIAIATDWRTGLICIGIFVLIVLIVRIVSVASVVAVTVYPFAIYFLFSAKEIYLSDPLNPFVISQRTFETTAAALFALIVIIKHLPNIKRLIKGEEKIIKFNK